MNIKDYTLKLLNFQETNIVIKKVELVNNVYYIYIDQIKDVNLSCNKCGGCSITNNFNYTRKIKHTPINGFPVIIVFNQTRYKCNYCGHTFNQPNEIVEVKKSISKELKAQIINETSYKQSFKDVSSRTNTSQTTVSNEFKRNIHNYRCKLSRIVCIDEFRASTIAGKYALIIGDPESGEILDILPSRLQDYIYHYFNTIDNSERFNVEYVVTDLNEAYRTICRNLFWKSIHIADRFRWIKLTTEAFNKTRINIMDSYTKVKNVDSDKKRYAAILKKYYKLLLANSYSKESWFFDQQVKTNSYGFTTYQSVIEYCVNNDRELEEAYLLLQELYKISKLASFETAKEKNIGMV